MSNEKQIKPPNKIAAGGRNDALIRTFAPTQDPGADVNPLVPPPFEIGGPAGRPANGSGQPGGSDNQSGGAKK
jgi:hypothetical protein